MNNSALPIEILEYINENLISDYKYAYLSRSDNIKFLPQWYLTPLLRVCKLWHMVSERFLYRRISIGRIFPRRKARRSGGNWEALPLRDGVEIAEELLAALINNPRAAALVEGLELGVESFSSSIKLWTQTNALIIQICPDVRHVEVRGFHPSELDTLTEALRQKSLVSFCISPQDIVSPDLQRLDFSEGASLRFLELMKSWPKLQSVYVEGFPRFAERKQPSAFRLSSVSDCCPDLQNIVFTVGCLRDIHLNAFRAMCSNVSKFMAPIYGSLDSMATLDALCGCLRAWAPTLQCFRLHIWSHAPSHRPLFEALSSLMILEELQVHKYELDFGAISNLPWLKRLRYTSVFTNEELGRLVRHLEDPAKFPVLEHIATFSTYNGNASGELRDLCLRRNIKLQMWDGRALISGFVL